MKSGGPREGVKHLALIFIIPAFFIFHEYVKVPDVVEFSQVLLYIIIHSIIAFGFLIFLLLLIKSVSKSILLLSFVLIFNYLFGSVHDALKKTFTDLLVVRYSFILPLICIAFIISILYFRKAENKFERLLTYLRILFLIFILADFFQLFFGSTVEQEKTLAGNSHKLSDTVYKPDIYLIVADEYAGYSQLKKLFRFDNSGFEDSLENKGFHIINNSVSNYNYTLYSVASMLSLNYLDTIQSLYDKEDINACLSIINHNYFFQVLKDVGYDIRNLSVFRINDNRQMTEDLFPFMGINLIKPQTFIERIKKDLGFHLVTTLNFKNVTKKKDEKEYEKRLRINLLIERILTKETKSAGVKPKFVYAHFIMPHDPFYFNKSGEPYPFFESPKDTVTIRNRYLEYLQFANNKYLDIIGNILVNSRRPPIVIFMSDHGSRLFNKEEEKKYQFSTINAIYIPNKNYKQFYEGMSNVNTLRVLLNTVFDHRLPILEDKSFYLKE